MTELTERIVVLAEPETREEPTAAEGLLMGSGVASRTAHH